MIQRAGGGDLVAPFVAAARLAEREAPAAYSALVHFVLPLCGRRQRVSRFGLIIVFLVGRRRWNDIAAVVV